MQSAIALNTAQQYQLEAARPLVDWAQRCVPVIEFYEQVLIIHDAEGEVCRLERIDGALQLTTPTLVLEGDPLRLTHVEDDDVLLAEFGPAANPPRGISFRILSTNGEPDYPADTCVLCIEYLCTNKTFIYPSMFKPRIDAALKVALESFLQ